jgi:putative nucleotidyltransferase with HDIG domain
MVQSLKLEERTMPTREQAWELVNEHTQSQSLVRHMLAVEAAMRAYAVKFGEDAELWGLVGLVHDFDYERYPDLSVEGHPVVGARMLREWDWPEEIVRAVLAHASEYTGVPAESRMEKTLVAVDELTGFLVAVALVRPSQDIRDITKISSVRKKWKDRAFAAAVQREEIEAACDGLGVDLWQEHVPLVLEAMQGIASELGLAGSGE